jgi:ABC-type polysaccharide/polyol phosphate export permease
VFICPVGYATSLVTGPWRWIYSLNPAVGIIDAFRWCILGKSELVFPPMSPAIRAEKLGKRYVINQGAAAA